ncbi:MAG: acetyl-CoA carboxylase biotin carboxyl carrier protein [Deferribacteraceae bacterium]|jgi:acetyl-CoA carboxylase biotin carboxyl carrier protein|nr:acetyl-CoA carboxylase biotin carboxyl carrier protein [Deferribacteraceae bacterium]
MNLKEIKELMQLFDESAIGELELEEGESRLYLSKTPSNANFAQPMMQMPQMMPAAPAMATPAPALTAEAPTAPAAKDEGNTINSPMIGTYYESATPGAPAFIKVGDIVEKGQTLCIIEAMKIMNTIESEFKCKILKFLIENGKPVEYGQPIFVVELL